jgi:hypothetical protein
MSGSVVGGGGEDGEQNEQLGSTWPAPWRR